MSKNESKPQQPPKPPTRPNVADDFETLTHADDIGVSFKADE